MSEDEMINLGDVHNYYHGGQPMAAPMQQQQERKSPGLLPILLLSLASGAGGAGLTAYLMSKQPPAIVDDLGLSPIITGDWEFIDETDDSAGK